MVSGASYVWSGSTSEGRGLERPDGGRFAATVFDSAAVEIDVTFTEDWSGPVHVYSLDWDWGGRAQSVSVGDGAAVGVSSFGGGVWTSAMVDAVAGETVRVRVERTAGANAVVSAVLLGDAVPSGGAVALPPVESGSGDWSGLVGADGAFVAGRLPSPTLPGGVASFSVAGGAAYTWNWDSSEDRAVEDPGRDGRIGAAWYAAGEVAIDARCIGRLRWLGGGSPCDRCSGRWVLRRFALVAVGRVTGVSLPWWWTAPAEQPPGSRWVSSGLTTIDAVERQRRDRRGRWS